MPRGSLRSVPLLGAVSASVVPVLCAGELAFAQAPAGEGSPAPAPSEPAPASPAALAASGQATRSTTAVVVGTTPPTEARDLSVQRPVTRPWQVIGEAQYRTLAVRDADPANDQRMIYRLGLNYAVLPQLVLAARGGMQQRFVAEPEESGLRLEDMALSALLLQSVDLAPSGWDRKLSLIHRLRFYLPTSRRSQQDDLYFAGEWMSRARVRLVDQLFAGLLGTFQYHAFDYAEQVGPGGEALPRVVAQALGFVEYSPIVSPSLGTLTLGADMFVDQVTDYPSRDPEDLAASELPPGTLAERTDTIIGAGSTDTFSSPHFGYDLYVVYQPPVEHLLVTASLEQAGNAVRYGESRVHFFHRDETEFALRVQLTY